jgi:hypothetical protein
VGGMHRGTTDGHYGREIPVKDSVQTLRSAMAPVSCLAVSLLLLFGLLCCCALPSSADEQVIPVGAPTRAHECRVLAVEANRACHLRCAHVMKYNSDIKHCNGGCDLAYGGDIAECKKIFLKRMEDKAEL